MKVKNIAALYMTSPEWMALSVNSRAAYERSLNYITDILKMDANKVSRPMLLDKRDELYDRGATCRLAFATLNNIFSYGYDRGLCNHNHAFGMKNMPKKKPRPRWTDEEVEKFDKGAKLYIRSIFLLALYTGQRRSDLYRMKWEQYDGQTIRILQQKTKKILYIPVHPRLKQELARLWNIRKVRNSKKPAHPYILSNFYNEPWTLAAVTNAVTEEAKRLGIVGKTIHGLRKTTAAKLAEIGCAPHLIAAITGHQTLKEIMNYTAEADQIRMAKEAMERWEIAEA